MASSRLRGRIAIITTFWGESESEQITVARLVAGALATQLHVDVLFLDKDATTRTTKADSAFTLHSFPYRELHPSQDLLLRLALTQRGELAELPEHFDAYLRATTGPVLGITEKIHELDPDAIILCGTVHNYDYAHLRGTNNRRIIFLPISKNTRQLYGENVALLIGAADQIIASHPGEERVLGESFPTRQTDIVPLDLALSVNRAATSNTLFGVRFFQPFVLLIRSFPPGGARLDRAITHEIVTTIAGRVTKEDVPESNWRYAYDDVPDELPISVAEVDGETWRLADNTNMLPLPVSPSRVNLWRLMAHALFTIDLRPGGAFGREAVESLLFGTPVIVPDFSAAKEHAERANAGLWYRNNGELLDSVRVLSDRTIRERFAQNGQRYAESHHANLPVFVERICQLILPSRSISL